MTDKQDKQDKPEVIRLGRLDEFAKMPEGKIVSVRLVDRRSRPDSGRDWGCGQEMADELTATVPEYGQNPT